MVMYKELGVRPVINVAGVLTRLGGALIEQQTVEAMSQAASESVRLDELQAAASKFISRITGAEAGYVTAGAFSALTLGTAACMTGLDISRMNRLPDTTGMPNEVLMEVHQRCGFDRGVQASGAKIINLGIPGGTILPGYSPVTSASEFEVNISERTAAIVYIYRSNSTPALEDVIDVGKKHNIPVFVNAAAQVPPAENLRKFISMGADLVTFSGGKGIRGPQSSGILCGRSDLIASVALQHLDWVQVPFEKWDPPSSLIPKEKLLGMPSQGIGRGSKVTKETIIGLLSALEQCSEKNASTYLKEMKVLLERISEDLNRVSGIEHQIDEWTPGGYPILKIKVDKSKAGKSAAEIVARLKTNDPRIYVFEGFLAESTIGIYGVNLNNERANLIAERLYKAVTS
jgi:D-glucosaminate-6-phosphate ammonia-lyase